jgi:hypothetical protein
MSAVDENEMVDSEETADEKQTRPVTNEKNENVGAGGLIILFFILGLAASLVVGWIIFPKLLYSQKKQPIDYNHLLHVEEVEEGCESCHFFREDGSFSGIPRLVQCIECHEEVQGDDPEEEKFVNEYVFKEKEVPWLVYSRQPDSVFFSHAAHIKRAEMDCVTCHGLIGESEHTRIYEKNRITGVSRDIWGKSIGGFKKNTWDRMKMDDCAECHAETGGRSDNQPNIPITGFFKNIIEVTFPGTSGPGRKTSAQTQHESCFVCHK